MNYKFDPIALRNALRNMVETASEKTGKSQAAIGRLADLTPGQMTRLLSNNNAERLDDPKLSYIARLCYVCGYSLDSLLIDAGIPTVARRTEPDTITDPKLRLALHKMLARDFTASPAVIDTILNLVTLTK